jgi:hypothetical protein
LILIFTNNFIKTQLIFIVMAIDFQLKDVLHNIIVKFVRAFLPNAQKPYYLKAVYQTEIDVHGIASKAGVYNIATDPKIIEEGMLAGMEIIYYLAADGYSIKTPLFNLKVSIPGSYDGNETHLPQDKYPRPAITVSNTLRKYIQEHVQVTIDGVDDVEGIITDLIDIYTQQHNAVLTRTRTLEVRGAGIKIAYDVASADQCGLFFVSEADPSIRIKCTMIVDNTPRNVKAYISTSLVVGEKYFIEIVTQSSPRHSGTLLKALRTVRSDIALIAQ